MPAPPPSAEDHAVGGQPHEADQRTIADGLDADDEIADGAADERSAAQQLPEQRAEPEAIAVGNVLVAEDAEQHPAEQSAQRPEDGVEVNSAEQRHVRFILIRRRSLELPCLL